MGVRRIPCRAVSPTCPGMARAAPTRSVSRAAAAAALALGILSRPGDRYARRLLDESERILRSNRYLYDAWIRPVAFRDGCVDIEVRTRDVWTLRPGISFERKGGKNTSSIDLQETNLLGLGAELGIARTFTADRTADSLEFSDAHLFGTWLSTGILLANTSAGSKRSYLLERPFYALDARLAAGVLFTE